MLLNLKTQTGLDNMTSTCEIHNALSVIRFSVLLNYFLFIVKISWLTKGVFFSSFVKFYNIIVVSLLNKIIMLKYAKCSHYQKCKNKLIVIYSNSLFDTVSITLGLSILAFKLMVKGSSSKGMSEFCFYLGMFRKIIISNGYGTP